jgi:hypothetical protein
MNENEFMKNLRQEESEQPKETEHDKHSCPSDERDFNPNQLKAEKIQPVSEEEKITAKKFLESKGLKDTLFDIDANPLNKVWIKGGLSKLLEEYASQKSAEKNPLPSDEEMFDEIELLVLSSIPNTPDLSKNSYYHEEIAKKKAKWLRSIAQGGEGK